MMHLRDMVPPASSFVVYNGTSSTKCRRWLQAEIDAIPCPRTTAPFVLEFLLH
jgi:hypothetical protein